MRWSDVHAVFGGRFDPPHLGHREAVEGLFRNPGVKRVSVIPSATPPHKPSIALAQDRLEMARLCYSGLPGVLVDDRELKRASLRPNYPSYTYDTLQEMKDEFSPFAFVIGTDQLVSLHAWYRFPEILSLCHWIVLKRKNSIHFDLEQKTLQEWEASGLVQSLGSQEWKIQKSSSRLILVHTDAPELSSTQIREDLGRTGTPPKDVLSPEVLSYLKTKKLYGI